jgi:predicted ATPase
VLDDLSRLTRDHPFRERFWSELLLALYRSGRQSDALAAYQDARKLLAEEKGLDPGPDLQHLEAAIIAQDPALELAPGSLAPAARRPSGNVSAPITRFIGRHDVLADVRRDVGDHRVVTLLGPGGTGKTRLALEVAVASRDEHADGCWFVDLATVADPDDAPAAVAAVMEAGGGSPGVGGDPAARAMAAIGDRDLLLVLDNCEHLLPGVAGFVQAAVDRCPQLHVLATSRQPLGVAGEVRRPVPPLGVPERGPDDPREIVSSEAVRLFEDRASAVLPTFELTDDTARDVAELCRRLDGLPLALELAAAWVATLPVHDIVEGLDERFRMLVRPATDGDRHASLLATVEWSYELLGEDERRLFETLSVFSGGSSLSAVVAVGAELGWDRVTTLDVLQRLVDRSLLVADTAAPDEPRYAMLETLQAYAAERAREHATWDVATRTHRRFVESFAARVEDGLLGAEHREWLRRALAEYPNLRRAFDGAIADDDADAALSIAAPLWNLWALTDRYEEGRRWLEGSLAVPAGASPDIRARALTSLSYVAGQARDFDRAREAGAEALEIAERSGSPWARAWAPVAMALVRTDLGDGEGALAYVEQARAVTSERGDDFRLAALDLVTCHAALRAGDLDAVAGAAAGVLDRCLRSGYQPFACWAQLLLGAVAQRAGRLDDAAASLETAIDIAHVGSIAYLGAFGRALLADVRFRGGDAAAARRMYTEVIEEAEAARSPWFAALGRNGLAGVLETQGEDDDAAALYEGVVAWAEGSDREPARGSFFVVVAGDPWAAALIALGARPGGDAAAVSRGLREAAAEQDRAAIASAFERSAAAGIVAAETAATLVGAATAFRERFRYPRSPLDETTVGRALDAARDDLGTTPLQAALARGAGMDLDEGVELLSTALGVEP